MKFHASDPWKRFEGDERDARWFIPGRAVGIQAESRVDLIDVGKVGNVGKALKVGIVGARMVLKSGMVLIASSDMVLLNPRAKGGN